MNTLFLFPVLALGISVGLTRLMITLGPKLGLMDEPGERRIHTKVIPRAGGIAIWITLMVCLGTMNLLFDLQGRLGSDWFLNFSIASLLLVIVGLIDDRWGMKAILKLGGHAGSAAVLFFLSNPDLSTGMVLGVAVPWYLDLLIWVVWTVIIINAFNLIDGLDGLCAGLALISVTSLTVMSLASRAVSDAAVLACMIGALLGFLRFNFNPAKIFLGDTGSMFIGFFIASVALNASGERFAAASLLLPIVVAGVPLIDVVLAVWRRGFKRWASTMGNDEEGKIFGADQEHLHHRLLALGLTQRKVATILYGLALIGSAFALIPYLFDDKTLGLTIGAILISVMMGLRYLAPVELKVSGEVLNLITERPARTRVSRFFLTCYDAAILLLGLLVAYLVLNKGQFPPLTLNELKQTTIAPTTAVTVALGLLCLNASKAHIRRWSRAGIRDFLSLTLWFIVGTISTVMLNVVISGELFSTLATHGIAFSLTFPLLFLPRAVGSLVRESVIDSLHRNVGRSSGNRPRVLLYGAGSLGHLFLGHLKVTAQDHFADMRILGFLDDHPSLNYNFLDGFRIRGGLGDLETLDERWDLHGIILTVTNLPSEKFQEIAHKCDQLGLKLYEWAPDLEVHRVNFSPNEVDM